MREAKHPATPGAGRPPTIHTLLVTGGCGYVGGQLIRDLAEDRSFAGVTIRILDNMQRPGYPALMDLPPTGRYEFIEGDILDPAAARRALEGVDAVVHLAALAKTPFSFDHPAWTEQVNHWGTAQLVEHCLELGVRRFIFASSASVYGPGGPFREEDQCRPVGPYAQSKWRAEQVVRVAASRGLRPTILRLATVFGHAPTMRFDAVPNRFAYLAGVGRPLTVFGTGEQTRPLVHVRDASAAIRFCLQRPELTEGETFNVVGENASVLDLVNAVRAARPDVEVRYTAQDVLTHLSCAVDGHKLGALGWEPHYSIEAGMMEVIARFRNIASPGMDLDFPPG